MSQDRAKKQQQFRTDEKKSSTGKILLGLALLAVAGVAGWMFTGSGVADSHAKVAPVSGEVRIDVSSVSDGQAHYFKLATAKGDIKFFVVKSIDGIVRAAFDACDVCYREKKGYRQAGDMMVCNNCDQEFRTDLVNQVKGGCNPAPLSRRLDGQQLVINERDLLSGSWYFGS